LVGPAPRERPRQALLSTGLPPRAGGIRLAVIGEEISLSLQKAKNRFPELLQTREARAGSRRRGDIARAPAFVLRIRPTTRSLLIMTNTSIARIARIDRPWILLQAADTREIGSMQNPARAITDKLRFEIVNIATNIVV